ncbi:hypothetical protein HK405_006141, partial [Cladochytrium tenue]
HSHSKTVEVFGKFMQPEHIDNVKVKDKHRNLFKNKKKKFTIFGKTFGTDSFLKSDERKRLKEDMRSLLRDNVTDQDLIK